MKTTIGTIQSLMDRLVESGREHGLQLAIYFEGKLVVDVWAGCVDIRTGEAVCGSTLFPVFSVTKGITTTVIHQLVEKGRLSYDMRLCEVWPEFGTHGKEAITLRHALTPHGGNS